MRALDLPGRPQGCVGDFNPNSSTNWLVSEIGGLHALRSRCHSRCFLSRAVGALNCPIRNAINCQSICRRGTSVADLPSPSSATPSLQTCVRQARMKQGRMISSPGQRHIAGTLLIVAACVKEGCIPA